MSFKWMESERAKETSWSQCGMKFLAVSECGFESHPGQSVCVFSKGCITVSFRWMESKMKAV